MMAFDISERVGDIVAAFPLAGDIFQQHRIDFCCGGNRTLADVAGEQNLDATLIVAELNQALETKLEASQSTDWSTAPLSDLVDHVLVTHHAYLAKELPGLYELTKKIFRVHGEHHGEELSQVYRLFHNLKAELEEHVIKEEVMIFPRLVTASKSHARDEILTVLQMIDELEAGHQSAGDVIKNLRIVTNDFQVPPDGCKTYELTYQKLEELERDLFQHIHLENNILFVRFRNLLTA